MGNVIDLDQVRRDRQATRIANKMVKVASEQCNDPEELWEFFGVPMPSAYCPQCSAPAFTALGQLGSLMHYRCEACGWVFETEAPE